MYMTDFFAFIFLHSFTVHICVIYDTCTSIYIFFTHIGSQFLPILAVFEFASKIFVHSTWIILKKYCFSEYLISVCLTLNF